LFACGNQLAAVDHAKTIFQMAVSPRKQLEEVITGLY